MRLALTLACATTVLALAGCKKKIGDPCQRSTDCSLAGDRVCDLSHRVNSSGEKSPNGSGECTIESCGASSCPGKSTCVKVYGSDFLTVACDPIREDIATKDGAGGVLPPRDDCDPAEVCLPEGLCADEITARTSCRRTCSDDDDCRNGYECVRTGARGVYRAPDPRKPGEIHDAQICVPKGS